MKSYNNYCMENKLNCFYKMNARLKCFVLHQRREIGLRKLTCARTIKESGKQRRSPDHLLRLFKLFRIDQKSKSVSIVGDMDDILEAQFTLRHQRQIPKGTCEHVGAQNLRMATYTYLRTEQVIL